MHCASCEQRLAHHADVQQPCPRCGGPVLLHDRWLLLSPWAHGFDAVDLQAGGRVQLWPRPSGALPDGVHPAGRFVWSQGSDDAVVALLEPEPLDDALFEAVFPELPAPSPTPPTEEAPPPPSRWRRFSRRAAVMGVSAMAAAQLGFALAPVPIDYSDQAHHSPGAEALYAEVAEHPAVQSCLSTHRQLPTRQSDAPALLTIERTPGMTSPHLTVRSTHPVLAGCLTSAARRLPLPDGRYALRVPIRDLSGVE